MNVRVPSEMLHVEGEAGFVINGGSNVGAPWLRSRFSSHCPPPPETPPMGLVQPSGSELPAAER